MLILLLLLVISLGWLILGWVAYPWWMARRARRGDTAPAPGVVAGAAPPRISAILATRESPDAIARRVQDLRTLRYPAGQLEVIVALDASSAASIDLVRQRVGDDVVVVAGAVAGKSSALNAGVRASSAGLLLFVDTAQRFDPGALEVLMTRLTQGSWGAMTATLAPTSGDPLMDGYWRRELDIREGQAKTHSVICVTGCAYVMERRYWREMPAGLICDDLWSTYSVVTQGGRVGIAQHAHVTDPRRFTREEEFGRRFRTMTGMLQFIRWFPAVLNPRRNPMWLHFLLHKVTRPLTPVLLAIAAVSGWLLLLRVSAGLAVGAAALAVAVPVVMLALARWGSARLRGQAQSLLFAGRMLAMPLFAIGRAVRSDWDVWRPHTPRGRGN